MSFASDAATLTLLRLAPSRNVDGAPVATVGDWRIELSSASGSMVPIHAYILLARGAIGTIQRGHQSTFAPASPSVTDITREAGTISGMACGSGATIIGCINEWATPGKPYPSYAEYCSEGPSRTGGHPYPDDYAAAEQLPSLHGILSMGNRSGVVFRMNGTSVATPQIARVAANGLPTGRSAGKQHPYRLSIP